MSAEVREFVDTNVLVYAYDHSAGSKHQEARDLLVRLWHENSGSLSVQVLQEFVVTTTRKIPLPLSLAEARSIVTQLTAWHVHTPAPTDVVHAVDLQEMFGVSFWDAMMLHSAHRLSCARIWSEDLNHGQTYLGIPVCNPFR